MIGIYNEYGGLEIIGFSEFPNKETAIDVMKYVTD